AIPAFHTKQPRRFLQTRALPLALAACLTLLSSPAIARDTSQPPTAQLEALNSEFRALYHQRTQQVLEALPLVLVVQNHTITAVRGTHRRLYPIPLQRYNEARAIVHTVLGFNGLMGSLAEGEEIAEPAKDANVAVRERARAQLPGFYQNLQ